MVYADPSVGIVVTAFQTVFTIQKKTPSFFLYLPSRIDKNLSERIDSTQKKIPPFLLKKKVLVHTPYGRDGLHRGVCFFLFVCRGLLWAIYTVARGMGIGSLG